MKSNKRFNKRSNSMITNDGVSNGINNNSKKITKKQADILVDNAVALQNKANEIVENAGDVKLRDKYFNEAKCLLLKALDIYPGHPDGLYNFGLLNTEMLDCFIDDNRLVFDDANSKYIDMEKLSYIFEQIQKSIDLFDVVIKNDTSKRGETTGLAYKAKSDVLLQNKHILWCHYYKTQLLQNVNTHINQDTTLYEQSYYEFICTVMQQSNTHFECACAMIEAQSLSHLPLDKWLLEYCNELYCSMSLFDKELHPNIELKRFHFNMGMEFKTKCYKTILGFLNRALQTQFTSGLDNDIYVVQCECILDVWKHCERYADVAPCLMKSEVVQASIEMCHTVTSIVVEETNFRRLKGVQAPKPTAVTGGSLGGGMKAVSLSSSSSGSGVGGGMKAVSLSSSSSGSGVGGGMKAVSLSSSSGSGVGGGVKAVSLSSSSGSGGSAGVSVHASAMASSKSASNHMQLSLRKEHDLLELTNEIRGYLLNCWASLCMNCSTKYAGRDVGWKSVCLNMSDQDQQQYMDPHFSFVPSYPQSGYWLATMAHHYLLCIKTHEKLLNECKEALGFASGNALGCNGSETLGSAELEECCIGNFAACENNSRNISLGEYFANMADMWFELSKCWNNSNGGINMVHSNREHLLSPDSESGMDGDINPDEVSMEVDSPYTKPDATNGVGSPNSSSGMVILLKKMIVHLNSISNTNSPDRSSNRIELLPHLLSKIYYTRALHLWLAPVSKIIVLHTNKCVLDMESNQLLMTHISYLCEYCCCSTSTKTHVATHACNNNTSINHDNSSYFEIEHMETIEAFNNVLYNLSILCYSRGEIAECRAVLGICIAMEAYMLLMKHYQSIKTKISDCRLNVKAYMNGARANMIEYIRNDADFNYCLIVTKYSEWFC